MAKKSLLLLIASFLLFFGGCAASSASSAGKIMPPSGQACPLEGKWEVQQELDTAGNTEKNSVAMDRERCAVRGWHRRIRRTCME